MTLAKRLKRKIRKWLGVDFTEDITIPSMKSVIFQHKEKIDTIEKAIGKAQDRLAEIESEIVKIEQHFSKEIAEIRERLEAPRRVSSHRPFTMMRALAEEGAKAQRNAPR